MNHIKESRRSRFGELLREFRLAAGLSQEALAERALISVEAISALERGINQAPHRETLALLVAALNLSGEQQRAIEESAQRRSRGRSASGQSPSNLPQTLTPLFGRAREIDELVDMLDRFALITLTGAGGVGKTRLAMQVGAHCAGRFVDGVWFVDLSPLRDPEVVPNAVAAVLSVTESLSRPLTDSILDALHNKSALLIIDNCEHLPEAASLIEALARAGRRLRVLATSRQSLGIAGETTYRVASLDMAAAIELFTDRARRVAASFELAGEGWDTVARICRQLDGIPFAIELAAARLTVLSPQQLEERLSQRFLLLTGGSRLALPRHQTMRALIDWSYDLLSDDEKVLLARLVVFAGTFSLEAASAVCRDEAIGEWRVFELLASLVDKSLVLSEAQGATQRYRLLESIRVYATERTPRDDVERLHRRHAEYYATFAARADERFATVPSTMSWSAELEPDTENIRAALDWALRDRNAIEVGISLLAGTCNFWLMRGLAAEGARRAEDALAVASPLPAALQAALWLMLAQMCGDVFSPAPSLAAATRACELYGELDDRLHLGRALRSRGVASMRLGRFDEAAADLHRALELSRSGGPRETSRALASVGVLLQITGQLAEARDALVQARSIAQDTGDDRMQSLMDVNLAECEFGLGDTSAAIGHATENLATAFLHANLQLRSNQEANLAAYLVGARREREARSVAIESARHARDSGDHGMIAIALGHAAATFAREDAPRAARLLGYVERVLESTGFTRELTERSTHELLMERLHESINDAQIASLVEFGAGMTEEQALRLAQRSVR